MLQKNNEKKINLQKQQKKYGVPNKASECFARASKCHSSNSLGSNPNVATEQRKVKAWGWLVPQT